MCSAIQLYALLFQDFCQTYTQFSPASSRNFFVSNANLFTLDRLCLHLKHILSNIPLKRPLRILYMLFVGLNVVTDRQILQLQTAFTLF